MNFMKNFDSSGVPIALSHNNETQFKSILGGFLSIIVYSLSLLYSIYIFYQWGNGELLPQIRTEQQALTEAAFTLEEGFLHFKIHGALPDDIDPFTSENNIILPLLIQFNASGRAEPIPIFSKESHTLVINSIDLNYKSGKDGFENQQLVLFTRCEQSVLKDAGTCASEESISKFFDTKLPFVIDIQIQLEQYNQKTKQNDKITKSTYFFIEEYLNVYAQILFQTARQKISSNFLFDTYTENSLVNSFQFVSQQITKSRSILDYDMLAMFLIRLDLISVVETIQFPKLGEVLAQIGSIVTVLLFTQHITTFLNQKQLECDLVRTMIEFYYPNHAKLKIHRTFYGKIIQVTLNDIVLSISQYQQFYKNISTKMKYKLNLGNIMYEITRIQLTLLQQFDKQKINNLKYYGIQLPIQCEEGQGDVVYPMELLEQQKDSDISTVDHQCSEQDIMIFSNYDKFNV